MHLANKHSFSQIVSTNKNFAVGLGRPFAIFLQLPTVSNKLAASSFKENLRNLCLYKEPQSKRKKYGKFVDHKQLLDLNY
jgi:hypothetical protein